MQSRATTVNQFDFLKLITFSGTVHLRFHAMETYGAFNGDAAIIHSTRNIICCSRKRISIQHVFDNKRFSFSGT